MQTALYFLGWDAQGDRARKHYVDTAKVEKSLVNQRGRETPSQLRICM